jgi:hypothetical protein
MRRHVQSVRDRRRDFRIAACRREAGRRERRDVVAVDQIMCDARMVRLLGEDRFEDRRRLLLVGEGLIGGKGIGIEGEGIEDRGLPVVGIILMS